MGRLKIALIVLGCMAVYWGGKEGWLAIHSSQSPQKIRCIDLIKNGPGDNGHVILTDFVACTEGFVYEADKNARDTGPYRKVYLPCLEIDGPWFRQYRSLYEKYGKEAEIPQPTNIRLILKLTNIRSEDELYKQMDKDTLQGLVINSVEGLDREEEKLLKKGYQDIDLSKCLILEVGRKPQSLGLPVLALLGGVAMVIAGIALLFVSRRPKAVAPTLPPAGPASNVQSQWPPQG